MLSRECKCSINAHSGVSLWTLKTVAFIATVIPQTILILIMSASSAMACSCSSPTICDLIQAPTIFIGEVIEGGITSIRQDPWDVSSHQVRLKVLERFRGLSKSQQTVDINLIQMPGMCAPNPYQLGGKYLVVPDQKNGAFYDGPCFSGREVTSLPADIQQIRQYFAGQMPGNVHGQVAATRHDDDLVGFLLQGGSAKPISGVVISASRQGKTYSTITDTDGRYTLPLPYAGTYNISASLKPYTSESAEISISGKGCATHDFALKIDNSISGRVLDESGQVVRDAKVGLIDLDRLSANPQRRSWFDDAYMDRDMKYTFVNVPLGRYLLVFNPEGPRSGGMFDLPLESTYHPGNSTRENARLVEIKSDGVHLTGLDLVVGKKIEFRHISVRVKFTDGTKMKTAVIVCTGLPVQEGDPLWTAQGFVSLSKADDGTVEFLAPANRKLRLEVKDSYGRDLKGVYTSFHEAGITPITQEFIVTP